MNWFWQKTSVGGEKPLNPIIIREEAPIATRVCALAGGSVADESISSPHRPEVGRPWSFVDFRRNAIQKIMNSLHEVYPVAAEEWEERVCHSLNQDRELGRWMHIARLYSRLTAPDVGRLSIEKKQDIFRILVACSTRTAREVLIRTERGVLSHREVKALVTAYFE